VAEKEGAGLDAGIKLSRGQGKAVLGLKGMAVWGRREGDWRQQSARFQAFGGRLVWRDWSEEGFDGAAMAMHVDRIMKEFESEKNEKVERI